MSDASDLERTRDALQLAALLAVEAGREARELRADRDRLREALERIELLSRSLPSPGPTLVKAGEVARSALADHGEAK